MFLPAHNDNNMSNEEWLCRICGLLLDEPPWGESGGQPSFEICPCCGVESGYQDYTFEGIQRYRAAWINGGAKWREPKESPEDWQLEEQLSHIPKQWVTAPSVFVRKKFRNYD